MTTPAWHDAPTEPGLWFYRERDVGFAEFLEPYHFPLRSFWKDGTRYYGPITIPEDSNEGDIPIPPDTKDSK